mmetsp:Transcript_15780/g.61653  ORF Transcript_15780/g.61653 Transcript_15780/m.61653 type:complete len:212 (+) Transcript_15780:459-1094(+)
MESAASTAPPPGTTILLSSVRLTAHSASCTDLSISSSANSFAPLSTIDAVFDSVQSRMKIISRSEIHSCCTSLAVPSISTGNDSSPSMFARVRQTEAPVVRAIMRMSSFVTRLTPITLASTKYFRQMSSIPFVVSTTLAPEARIFSMRSLVMSSSLCLIFSSSIGSVTVSLTPWCILCLVRSKSRQAIFASVMRRGIARVPTVQLRAKPST